MCKELNYYSVYSVLHGGVVQGDGDRQEWFLVSSVVLFGYLSLSNLSNVSNLKTNLPTAQLHSLPLFPFYCKLVKVLKKPSKIKIKNSWGICVN